MNLRFSVPPTVSMWDAETVSGWFVRVWFSPWSMEEEVWWWLFKIQNSGHTEPAWLPRHSAATCHPMWFVLSGTIIGFSTGQRPKKLLQATKWLFNQEGEWWSAASDDLAPRSPDPNPAEMVWEELDHRVKEKQPASAQHLWELLQDCWKTVPGDDLTRTSRVIIKANGGYSEESKISNMFWFL